MGLIYGIDMAHGVSYKIDFNISKVTALDDLTKAISITVDSSLVWAVTSDYKIHKFDGSWS